MVKNNFAFGKKGDTYAAFIGANELNYADSLQTELIQKGKQVFWITEAGSKSEDGTFEDFMARVQKNSLNFDSKNLVLLYQSREGNYELKYNEVFKVNDQPVDSNYSRYQSPYIVANKKAKTFKFELNGHSLFLDFDHMIRTIN